jgi:hypothetical protein
MTLRKTLSITLILLGFLIAILGRLTLLAGIPFFLIGVILNFTTDRQVLIKLTWTIFPILLWLPSMLGVWYLSNKAVATGDTYIFPKGFHGQAVIAFGLKKGNTATIKNGRRVFSFDTSGIIVTQADPPKGIIDQKFFYQDTNGELRPLSVYSYMQDKAEDKDSSRTKIFGWQEKGSTSLKDCNYTFFNFKVCSLAELNTIDNGFKSWKLHDKIKQQACGQ